MCYRTTDAFTVMPDRMLLDRFHTNGGTLVNAYTNTEKLPLHCTIPTLETS